MKETLKSIYQDKMVENVDTFDFDKYYYFVDDHQRIFGIKRSAISSNEKRLIESQYDPFDATHLKADGLPLFSFLFGHGEIPKAIQQLKYYFIRFFSSLEPELQQELFTVLVDSFERKVYINRKRDVLMILSESSNDLDFQNLLKSIEGDFMIQIIGFESDEMALSFHTPLRFQFDLNTFMDLKYHEPILIKKSELVKHFVLHQIEDANSQTVRSYVLQNYQQDQEMLKVIRSYFETNFNVTLAAKKCYMHRNTFQNKLDKFISETHFNIREYDDAFIVYLALQLS